MKSAGMECLRRLRSGVFLFSVCLTITACSGRQEPPAAAIASAHPLATRAGMDILAAGGNAFDAAVAVSAALAVVEPYSSGLGGGGFWLLHRGDDGFEVVVDGRERAPLAATREMFLDDDGDVVPDLSLTGALAAGIPGEVAALVHIAADYGRLPLSRTLAPAIRLAREGFEVDERYRRLAGFRLAAMQEDEETARIFLHDATVPAAGYVLRQPELAETLDDIARQGAAGFYGGRVARQLVDGVRRNGGLWTLEDLARYEVIERQPVTGHYRGRRITSVGPPSSGGVVLLTMLNILSGLPLDAADQVTRTHLVIEAMRRAYRDRALYLGDPDFAAVPVAMLTGAAHAAVLRNSIQLDHATPSAALGDTAPVIQGPDTTHFSVLDREGNRVAATLSINYPFGACLTPPGTGVLLNDEMDDFSIKRGTPNAYELVGGEANAVGPGKRPLSSMTPTFVEDADGVAILGTPGGSRIITMVLLAVLDMTGENRPQSWVSRPRFHHQYLPDEVQYEPGAFDSALIEGLTARGHRLKALDSPYGNMQAIYWDKKDRRVYAASDPRGVGEAWVGPSND
jgi:gamma-glutamyltranspeptidase / glutathione hydrolase